MIKEIKQKGFLMIEALLVVSIVIVLSIWWFRQEQVNAKKQTAELMKEQTANIIHAVDIIYKNPTNKSEWPPAVLAKSISSKGGESNTDGCVNVRQIPALTQYLSAKNLSDPFGNDYQLCVSSDASGQSDQNARKTIALHTNIDPNDEDNLIAAQKAASALAGARVDINHSDKSIAPRLSINIHQPIANSTDRKAVHTIKVVHPGDLITFAEVKSENPSCNVENDMEAFTSIVSCYAPGSAAASTKSDDQNDGMQACEASAEKTSQGWVIHMRILTRLGWIASNGIQGNIDKAKNAVQVTFKCSK